jgi:hypothetical protein
VLPTKTPDVGTTVVAEDLALLGADVEAVGDFIRGKYAAHPQEED